MFQQQAQWSNQELLAKYNQLVRQQPDSQFARQLVTLVCKLHAITPTLKHFCEQSVTNPDVLATLKTLHQEILTEKAGLSHLGAEGDQRILYERLYTRLFTQIWNTPNANWIVEHCQSIIAHPHLTPNELLLRRMFRPIPKAMEVIHENYFAALLEKRSREDQLTVVDELSTPLAQDTLIRLRENNIYNTTYLALPGIERFYCDIFRFFDDGLITLIFFILMIYTAYLTLASYFSSDPGYGDQAVLFWQITGAVFAGYTALTASITTILGPRIHDPFSAEGMPQERKSQIINTIYQSLQAAAIEN